MSLIDDFEKNVVTRIELLMPKDDNRQKSNARSSSGGVPSASAFLFGMCFGVVAARIACVPFNRLAPE